MRYAPFNQVVVKFQLEQKPTKYSGIKNELR